MNEDIIKHPKHYIRGGMECIDVINAAVEGLPSGEGYYVGNVIKYIWRYSEKNGLEDLDKAIQYIEMLKKYIQSKND